ncbi:MAG TPA: isochorismatase family cysteine hydrolase [Rhizomicrobium sp.]|nr:isochorismatase family cysteine hydrolase [Rhizomicrobium sp.]
MTPDWIAPKRTALLLIDFQVDFASPDGAMADRGADLDDVPAALAQAVRLADAARAAHVPVVFVRLITRPGSESKVAREASQRHGDEPPLCAEGTHGADFFGPRPKPGEAIISKSRFNAFAGTGLADQLHGQGIDTLVLAGLTTECCVAATAWAGFELDFHVFIAADACAAYEEDLHFSTLEALQLSGAMLGETAEFAQNWKRPS